MNLGDHKYFGGMINVISMQQKQEIIKGLLRNKSHIQFYSNLFNNNVKKTTMQSMCIVLKMLS